MNESTMKKRLALTLCTVVLAIPGLSQAQSQSKGDAATLPSEENASKVSDRAGEALDALENAEDAPLFTSEDADKALKNSALNAEAQAESKTPEGEDGTKYQSAPPTIGDDTRYLSAPPSDNAPVAEEKLLSEADLEAQMKTSQERKAQAIARSEEASWASLVRMELGLGWSSGLSSYDDIYGADESLYSFGPTGFLALKFRLSQRIPLQLGVDASFSYHPWGRDPASSATYGGYNGARMGMGNVTLTAFMNDIFYLMLGLGMGGLQQDVEYRWTFDGKDSRAVKLGATGIAAAGVEFNLARAFRLGLELRAFGGVFDRDSFGAVGGYVVFSFF